MPYILLGLGGLLLLDAAIWLVAYRRQAASTSTDPDNRKFDNDIRQINANLAVIITNVVIITLLQVVRLIVSWLRGPYAS